MVLSSEEKWKNIGKTTVIDTKNNMNSLMLG